MKVCLIIVGVLAACAVTMAVEGGPVIAALQPVEHPEQPQAVEAAGEAQPRQKRGLLLAGAGLAGLGLLGAAGVGAVGAGALVGAKAGLIGGVLASKAVHHGYGRSYGGYGGYGGYGYGHGGYGYGHGGYGYGHGGYGGGYYEPTYYRSYSSYPTYYEESW